MFLYQCADNMCVLISLARQGNDCVYNMPRLPAKKKVKPMKKVNLPNKLTILRLLLVPLFTAFMLIDGRLMPIFALITFAAASVTDFFDGRIARKQGLVTDFGKFFDPIADKILVLSAFICMIPSGLCSPVVAVIVLTREFLISSLRLIAASHSVVLAAGKSGKIKTASQMFSIVTVLVLLSARSIFGVNIPVEIISNILMWLASAAAVYSGIEYVWRNRQLLDLG